MFKSRFISFHVPPRETTSKGEDARAAPRQNTPTSHPHTHQDHEVPPKAQQKGSTCKRSHERKKSAHICPTKRNKKIILDQEYTVSLSLSEDDTRGIASYVIATIFDPHHQHYQQLNCNFVISQKPGSFTTKFDPLDTLTTFLHSNISSCNTLRISNGQRGPPRKQERQKKRRKKKM